MRSERRDDALGDGRAALEGEGVADGHAPRRRPASASESPELHRGQPAGARSSAPRGRRWVAAEDPSVVALPSARA